MQSHSGLIAQSRTGFHPDAIISLLACLAPGTGLQRGDGNRSPHLGPISSLAVVLLCIYLWSFDLWFRVRGSTVKTM